MDNQKKIQAVSQMSQKEKEKFMNSIPSRQDVVNYVMNVLYQEVVPSMKSFTEERLSDISIGVSILQMLLIRAGITTEQEILLLRKDLKKAIEKQATEKSDEQPESEDETDTEGRE